MLMDWNYLWCQPEERIEAGRVWGKAMRGSLQRGIEVDSGISSSSTESVILDTSARDALNDIPIYSAFSRYPKDSIHNPPFILDQEKASKLHDKDSFTSQLLKMVKKKREYNKGSTYGYELQIQRGMLSTNAIDLYPWNKTRKDYTKNLTGLHEEILDFYTYIMPTEEEKIMRECVIVKLRNVIHKEWPDAVVDVFGSFKTELHLPTSDIDVVINGKWDNPLWKLSEIIRRSGIASDCKVLDKATVPIVKMTDRESDVRIDISFNMANGIKSADLIKAYIGKFPQLPKLVLVLKQYLLQRDLNEVWTGGISSYSLILMCVSFMKHCTKNNLDSFTNLGRTLILFLELYGRNFDYLNTAIRTEGDISFVPKEEIMKNMDGSHWSSILCIEDPLNPGNDIGRSSYGALHVKLAFDYAYSKLSPVVLHQSSHLFEDQVSILGRIIRITPEVVKYRTVIKKKYSAFRFPSKTLPHNHAQNDIESVKNEPHTNNSNIVRKNPYDNISEKGDVGTKRDSSQSTRGYKPTSSYNFNYHNNNSKKPPGTNIQDSRPSSHHTRVSTDTRNNSPTSASNKIQEQVPSKHFKKNVEIGRPSP